MRRIVPQEPFVFINVREKYRVPLRAISDLMSALNDNVPLPQRVAAVRFWTIYFKAIGLSAPELPPSEEMTVDKVREMAEKLIELIAKGIGIQEEV